MNRKILGLKLAVTEFRGGQPSISWAMVEVPEDPFYYKTALSKREVMDKAKQLIGDYLKEARESQQMTVEDAAKLAGIETEAFEAIETGGQYAVEDLLSVTNALSLKIFFGPK